MSLKFLLFFNFDIGHQERLEKNNHLQITFELKAQNIFVEGKKQVGEHVEKSPEPKK